MMPGSSTKPERGEYQRNQEKRGTQNKKDKKKKQTKLEEEMIDKQGAKLKEDDLLRTRWAPHLGLRSP
jgi:hypothetical protein